MVLVRMLDVSCLASWVVGSRSAGRTLFVVQSPARHLVPAPVRVVMTRAVIVDGNH